MNWPAPILLASRSPRRAMLLQREGWSVQIEAPSVDDGQLHSGDVEPAEWVEAMAWLKARAVAAARTEETPCTIIGADTICVLDGQILGQPADEAAARMMLESFVGRAHDVLTGVCLYAFPEGRRSLFVDQAEVTWGALEPAAIEAYLAGGTWRGKAGAYNLEDRVEDGWPIQWEGDPTTIMGLPMERLRALLGDGAIPA